ncbi:MAG: large conductance mechanosensitive channel [Nocardioidaceae bacterium]|jgi:large conductance mechanosensitive channel|nr:large conductance mechanosensitive channel [Nocardioidaceae bacterium]
MKGFRDFILRGNLVELAVAFIMATAFAAVVTAFVQIILDIVGKLGSSPDFSNYTPGGVHVGAFLTALIAFLVLAAVVYYFVVVPYLKARERFMPKAESGPSDDVALLTEIRDLLRERPGRV